MTNLNEIEDMETRLRELFQQTPVESGMTHPAEEILGRCLASRTEETANWVLRLSEDPKQAVFFSEVLLCMKVQPSPVNADWRAKVVRAGLASDDPEARDAAIDAAEHWGDAQFVKILNDHEEPVGYLRDYITQVVLDLSDDS